MNKLIKSFLLFVVTAYGWAYSSHALDESTAWWAVPTAYIAGLSAFFLMIYTAVTFVAWLDQRKD